MFRKLIRNKKAQQTAEYALLISLVVAAVIAMQTYVQRSIQARIHDASSYLTSQTSAMGNTEQYEPYYLETDYDISRDDTTTETHGRRADNTALIKKASVSNRIRAANGYQVSTYNAELFGLNADNF